MTVAIALFTRDLRVHDNPVLRGAVAGADQVIPLFVLDQGIADAGYLSPNRGRFLADCLRDLDMQLADRGSRLVVRRGEVVDQVARLVRQHHVETVHLAADVSAYARRREQALESRLRELRCDLHVHDDVVTVVPPGAVTPQGSDHFAVFTPYYRRWADVPRRASHRAPTTLAAHPADPGPLPAPADICRGEPAPDLPEGGETVARALLRGWSRRVSAYEERHDDLAGDATSRLSAHLHFGSLSALEAVHRIGGDEPGRQAFVRQLAWRDFNHQLLGARPAAAWRDYRPHGAPWRDAPEDLEAWKQGRTGYPIVDAGMRQLLREGWMHNRARLIVGSFLTKTLLIDWRLGARHFLDHLVDGDIANNQLNWQWVAGTGTDTRPGRVLNPLRQAERYDPDGDYVRRYVPELAHLAPPAIHQPWTLADSPDYPGPLVDLKAGRTRFQQARNTQTSLF